MACRLLRRIQTLLFVHLKCQLESKFCVKQILFRNNM